jgi:hypothetical protein
LFVSFPIFSPLLGFAKKRGYFRVALSICLVNVIDGKS